MLQSPYETAMSPDEMPSPASTTTSGSDAWSPMSAARKQLVQSDEDTWDPLMGKVMESHEDAPCQLLSPEEAARLAKRDRNNKASRDSRARKKSKFLWIEGRIAELEKENKELKQQLRQRLRLLPNYGVHAVEIPDEE